VLPKSNANYGWILNMASKLSKNGVTGFILANFLSRQRVLRKIRGEWTME
jgi:type I restriction-modification system DNA methylase subunit